MSEVIDLTDEPDAKRQNVDLSKDISDLGSDLMQKVFENLPLREQARAAMASKDMKGAYDVARGNLLADADGKLKHLVHYYQKRIERPHIESDYLNRWHVMGLGGLSLRGRTNTCRRQGMRFRLIYPAVQILTKSRSRRRSRSQRRSRSWPLKTFLI